MLVANGIGFSYRNKQVLHALNLTVHPGDFVCIVGRNGCGKTTLLSILSGSVRPTVGELFYQGVNTASAPDVFLNQIGYVPQENPILGDLSVYDNLRFWFHGNAAELDVILKEPIFLSLGIQELLKSKASKLSGGQKKKVNIAGALINHPSILILDEPSSSLDVCMKQEISNFLQTFHSIGGTIILASHEESELMISNQIFVMKDGFLTQVTGTVNRNSLLSLLM